MHANDFFPCLSEKSAFLSLEVFARGHGSRLWQLGTWSLWWEHGHKIVACRRGGEFSRTILNIGTEVDILRNNDFSTTFGVDILVMVKNAHLAMNRQTIVVGGRRSRSAGAVRAWNQKVNCDHLLEIR
jgi:hypothetical protein